MLVLLVQGYPPVRVAPTATAAEKFAAQQLREYLGNMSLRLNTSALSQYVEWRSVCDTMHAA